jgi:hypothetical protein
MQQRHSQGDSPVIRNDPSDEIGTLAAVKNPANHLDSSRVAVAMRPLQLVCHASGDPRQHLSHGTMVYLDIAVIRKYLPDDRFNGTGQGVGTAKRFGRARQGRRVVLVDKLDLPIDANGTEDTPGDRIEKGFGQFPIIH